MPLNGYTNTFGATTGIGQGLQNIAAAMFGGPSPLDAEKAAATAASLKSTAAYHDALARKAIIEADNAASQQAARTEFDSPIAQAMHLSQITGLPQQVVTNMNNMRASGRAFPLVMAPAAEKYDLGNQVLFDEQQANLNPKGNNFDLGQSMTRLIKARAEQEALNGELPLQSIQSYAALDGKNSNQHTANGAVVDAYGHVSNQLPTENPTIASVIKENLAQANDHNASATEHSAGAKLKGTQQQLLSVGGKQGGGTVIMGADGVTPALLLPTGEAGAATPQKPVPGAAAAARATQKQIDEENSVLQAMDTLMQTDPVIAKKAMSAKGSKLGGTLAEVLKKMPAKNGDPEHDQGIDNFNAWYSAYNAPAPAPQYETTWYGGQGDEIPRPAYVPKHTSRNKGGQQQLIPQGASGGTVDAAETPESIKAAYKAGKLTREQAKAKLQAHGFK